MDRRHYIRSLFILGGTGVASFSIFKYLKIVEPFDANLLHAKTDIIAELAELIIPKTDTPGAKEVGIQWFIVGVILNCNNLRQQKRFLSGIENLEEYAYDRYDRAFLRCDVQEKREILLHFSEHRISSNKLINKIDRKIFGEAFYTKLRALVVEGYCCSKIGATMGLVYDYIPGNYEACIPLKLNQKSWATK